MDKTNEQLWSEITDEYLSLPDDVLELSGRGSEEEDRLITLEGAKDIAFMVMEKMRK